MESGLDIGLEIMTSGQTIKEKMWREEKIGSTERKLL